MERRNQVKVSFQDHPPNVPKMDPNLAPPRPQGPKMCITRVLSRPLRMDLKKILLSRPLQTGLITLTLNTWYLVPVDEVTQVVSDPKTKKKMQPAIEQPSSGPPPPGS